MENYTHAWFMTWRALIAIWIVLIAGGVLVAVPRWLKAASGSRYGEALRRTLVTWGSLAVASCIAVGWLEWARGMHDYEWVVNMCFVTHFLVASTMDQKVASASPRLLHYYAIWSSVFSGLVVVSALAFAYGATIPIQVVVGLGTLIAVLATAYWFLYRRRVGFNSQTGKSVSRTG